MSPRAVGWLLAMLTACEGGRSTDISPSLRFAAFSDASIVRFIEAAIGIEGERARSLVHAYELPSGECPAIDLDAAARTVRVTACAGTELTGSAELTNIAWTGIANDLAEPATYTFHGFGTNVRYDGTVVYGPSLAYFDVDLTTAREGMTVRSDLYLPCTADRCELRGGIELLGGGGALVSGSATDDVVQLAIDGYDTLLVEVIDDCARWRIMSTNRAFSSCEQ